MLCWAFCVFQAAGIDSLIRKWIEERTAEAHGGSSVLGFLLWFTWPVLLAGLVAQVLRVPLLTFVLSSLVAASLVLGAEGWSSLTPFDWPHWAFGAHVTIYVAPTIVAAVMITCRAEAHGVSLPVFWRKEGELQVAQLRALRAQLQPHFLFNTLHSIGVTATRDGHAAQRMTTLLGDMLRHTLADRAGQPIPLREELVALAPYLELQRVRFQDRLQVDVVVPDDLLDILVPDLLLQPLVENAIQHGIEQRPGAGRLRIVAELTHVHFQVRVEDDGVPPPQNGAPPATGTGLSATRERLRVLYGDKAWLELKTNELGGTTVVVELPVQRSTRAA